MSHKRVNDITCLCKAKVLFLPLTPFSLSQQLTINHQVPSILTLQISWLCVFFPPHHDFNLLHDHLLFGYSSSLWTSYLLPAYPKLSSMISSLHYSWVGFFFLINYKSDHIIPYLKHFNDSFIWLQDKVQTHKIIYKGFCSHLFSFIPCQSFSYFTSGSPKLLAAMPACSVFITIIITFLYMYRSSHHAIPFSWLISTNSPGVRFI